MSAFYKYTVFLLLGAFLGLGSVWYVLEDSQLFFKIRTGPWILMPLAGDPDADPYTLAHFSRNGMLPAKALEVMYFFAGQDDKGEKLDGRCSYIVSGRPVDAARWSLSIYGQDGRPLKNPAERYGFNSENIIWANREAFQINISPEVSPGNWLPGGADGKRLLILRLYNPSRNYIAGPMSTPLPSIRKTQC